MVLEGTLVELLETKGTHFLLLLLKYHWQGFGYHILKFAIQNQIASARTVRGPVFKKRRERVGAGNWISKKSWMGAIGAVVLSFRSHKGIPVLFQGSFESTKRPRVVGFRCRILDNGLFILKLSGSCGSVMTHLSPTGKWFTHSSLLSHSNSLRETWEGARTTPLK